MNIVWAFLVISASVSIIVGFETAFVYAQSSTNNATGLPPIELESVEPNTTPTSKENSTEYLQYEDSDIGFKMDYPSNWEVDTSELINNAVVAFSPDGGNVQVNVKLFPRQNSESLKTFGNALRNDDQLTLSSFYRNSTTLLGGQPAIRMLGTYLFTPNIYESMTGQQPTTQKVLDMITLLNGKKSFLGVIYYADKSNFNDYLPVVEHMIKSFQFQDTKPIIQEED